ncbi:MAG TPA: nuclease-related domain-containing protein [Candidatus Limnocylindrales bacterium]|nr:nuclease-related domain-containing protein [Candidatus Limnocylindrales bacterium]
MHDQPAATRHIEAGAAADDGLSAQQRFELERVRASAVPATTIDRLRALLAGRTPGVAAPSRRTVPPARHLEGIEAVGGVMLGGLRTSYGRRRIDHLVIAPSGIYAVEDRPWRGQVAVTAEELYVDGRLRAGVPEGALRTAAGVQQSLAEELAPFGLVVTPVIALPGAETAWRSWQVQGVLVVCGRGLSRLVRQRPGLMGVDTVVRLALAADRLLEEA